jgi:hypothetical protein
MGTVCRQLGFPHFTPRSLRKFGIVRLLRSGVNVKLVSKWQGHQDGGKLILDTYRHKMSDRMTIFSRMTHQDTARYSDVVDDTVQVSEPNCREVLASLRRSRSRGLVRTARLDPRHPSGPRARKWNCFIQGGPKSGWPKRVIREWLIFAIFSTRARFGVSTLKALCMSKGHCDA